MKGLGVSLKKPLIKFDDELQVWNVIFTTVWQKNKSKEKASSKPALLMI
jgi:hypothetical protein